MEYPTRLSGRIKFWHPSASVKDVEQAFGLTASKSHGVGELRVRGDRSTYKDTYCLFEIAPEQDAEFNNIVSACIAKLPESRAAIDDLIATGGKFVVVVQVFDRNFIQLFLDSGYIAKLHIVKAGIVIENHSAE